MMVLLVLRAGPSCVRSGDWPRTLGVGELLRWKRVQRRAGPAWGARSDDEPQSRRVSFKVGCGCNSNPSGFNAMVLQTMSKDIASKRALVLRRLPLKQRRGRNAGGVTRVCTQARGVDKDITRMLTYDWNAE